MFGDRGVNSHLVSFNRTVLLHGPPGTGKTTLCKALAQKLAMRFRSRCWPPQLEVLACTAHDSVLVRWHAWRG